MNKASHGVRRYDAEVVDIFQSLLQNSRFLQLSTHLFTPMGHSPTTIFKMAPTSTSPKAQSNSAIIEFILNGPALAPPKGVTPQLDGHWDEQYWWYIVVSLCMGIMAVFILVRIYTKWKIVKKFEAADCRYLNNGAEPKANTSQTSSLPAM